MRLSAVDPVLYRNTDLWTLGRSLCRRAHGVVVSRLLRMQKALGSNPSGSICCVVEMDAAVLFSVLAGRKTGKVLRGGIEPPTSRV